MHTQPTLTNPPHKVPSLGAHEHVTTKHIPITTGFQISVAHMTPVLLVSRGQEIMNFFIIDFIETNFNFKTTSLQKMECTKKSILGFNKTIHLPLQLWCYLFWWTTLLQSEGWYQCYQIPPWCWNKYGSFLNKTRHQIDFLTNMTSLSQSKKKKKTCTTLSKELLKP